MTGARAERTAWITGGIGLLGAVIGWIVTPRLFAHAWLAALACWIAWPIGSMTLLLFHAVTGGRWGYAVRPALALGLATLPLVLPAVLPLLVEARVLYPWAQPDIARTLGNTNYLNLPFACGRAVLYLVVWLGLGALMLRALRGSTPDPSLYRLAAPGMILLMPTVTFAAFDATMSLDPHFSSSIYGMVTAAEAALFAHAIATFVTLAIAPPPRVLIADLGKLMLGLLVLWGYLEFMQLLIVWNSDLGSDAPWYVLRSTPGWAVIAGLVFILHFLVPFFLLLWPQVQGSRRMMLAISGMLIAGEILAVWWLVVPAAGRMLSWVDPFAMLATGGLGAGVAISASRRWALAEPVVQHG